VARVLFSRIPLVTRMSECSLTVQSCDVWINELVKIDSCLRDYFTAVAFLHVANRIAKHILSDDLLDVLATVIGKFVGVFTRCDRRGDRSRD